MDPARLLRARHRIRDYLHAQGASPRVIDDVVLAVQEAMSNAVRHSGTAEDLRIALAFEGPDLKVEVSDRGAGFEVSSFDPARIPDLEQTSGRGLYLISRLMDELELCHDEGLVLRAVKHDVLPSLSPEGVAPAALAHRDARQLALLEEIDEGYYALDWEYRFIMANSAYQRLVGIGLDDLIGRTLWELFPRLRDHEAGAAVRDAMELGTPAMLEYLSPTLQRWFELRAYPAATGVVVYSRDVDRRKRGELEQDKLMTRLAASEERFAAIFEESPMAIGLASLPEGLFGKVNRAFEELFGFSRGAVAPGTAPTLSTLGVDQHSEEMALFLRQGRVRDIECTLRARDGRHISVSMSLNKVTIGDRQHVLVTIRDVTASRRAEEALRENERLLRTVFENSLDGINMLDLDTGRYVLLSPAQVEMTGFSEEELRGISAVEAYDRTHPEDRDITMLQQRRVAAGEESGDPVEYRWKVKSGEYRWFSDRRRLVRDEHGRPVALVGLSRDITDRKRADEALRQGEQQFRTLFESMTEGVALHEIVYVQGVAADYRILQVNPSYERQSGLRAPDVVGRLASEVYGTGEPPYLATYARVAAEGRPESFETYFPPLGRHFRIAVVSPVRGQFATIFEDITERKLADEERERLLERFQTQAELLRRQSEELHAQTSKLSSRAHLAEVLNRVNDEVHAALDFDIVVKRALDVAVDALGFAGGTIEMREGASWVVRYEHNFPEDLGLVLNDDEAAVAREAMVTMQSVAIDDLEGAAAQSSGLVRRRGLRSVLAVPLLSRGSVIGCLLLFDTVPRAFEDLDIDFGRKLGATLSLALENVRLHEASLEAAEHERLEARLSQTLLEAAMTISSSLSLPEVLDSLLDVVLARTGRRRAFLNALDDERRELKVLAGKGPYLPPPGTVIPYDRLSPIARRAVAERRTQVLDYDAEQASRSHAATYHSHLVLYVPVFVGDRMIGHLSVDSAEEAEPFGDEEIKLVQGIAAEAAISIENARLYEAQRRIATTLQENLMHPLPVIDGLELAVVSQPAYEPELVGGDFHDAFVLPAGSVVILIGDVMGKGVEAAGLTETARSAVRALSIAGLSPAEVLKHTNQVLLSETHDQFVSLLMVVLDPGSGHAMLASAGHPAPVLVSQSGACFLDPEYGPLLGVYESDYQAREFVLRTGESLVFYTDGLVEARRGERQFGARALLETLNDLRAASPRALVHGVRETVLTFAGTLRDDLEIMAVRRKRRLDEAESDRRTSSGGA